MEIKGIVLLCLGLALVSCKSIGKLEDTSNCGDNYKCFTEVISNKSIKILEDTIGEKYLILEDNEDYDVIKYTYRYEGSLKIADYQYEENIYFQYPNNQEKLNLSGVDLLKVKLIVKKSCFCVDAGYELIKDGRLKVTKDGSTYCIDLHYKTTKEVTIKSLQTSIAY